MLHIHSRLYCNVVPSLASLEMYVFLLSTIFPKSFMVDFWILSSLRSSSLYQLLFLIYMIIVKQPIRLYLNVLSP